MNRFILITLSALTLIVNTGASAHQTEVSIQESKTVYHVGGCRKSSSAGQSCHMNRKTGVIHCH